MTKLYTVNDHFDHKDSSVRALYDQLVKVLRTFGPIEEDPKKTSIHLNRRTALAGVETRKDCLLLNIKSDRVIESPRIERVERVSANRFHYRIRITSSKDFDKELRSWLEQAYTLST